MFAHKSRTVVGWVAIAWIGGCSGTEEQEIGSTSDPLNGGPANSTFYYLRCNSTDWDVDEISRLLPSQDPNVLVRPITVSNPWADSCSVTVVIASGPDQWGISQTYLASPGHATLVVPGSTSLVSSAQQVLFGVQYPQLGPYVATFNIGAQTLTILAQGAQDGGTDAARDAGADAARDTGVDSPRDTGADSPRDTGVDSARDTGTDAVADRGQDTGRDASADTGSDARQDSSADATSDASVDRGSEAGQDSGIDARADSGFDANIDAGSGGSWQPLTTQPSFAADTPLLLTDGSVLVHLYQSSSWSRLIPSATGSYVNGSWSPTAPMPSGYTPLYFASAVLPDGRVLVEGGEYNEGVLTWTNLGAIYDPKTDVWRAVSPPAGWTSIGDATSAVLSNGVFMLSNALSAEQALFNATTLTWTTTGSGKADSNNEEGWTLLPGGKVLTADCSNAPQSELYNPATGAWTNAGSTITPLVDVASDEIGPSVLMPNGVVFQTGATPHTALYNTLTGTWTPGPDFPVFPEGQLNIADGPAALLPNGHVLCAASHGVFLSPTHFLEFDGTALSVVAATPNAPNIPSFAARLLILPTGQALEIDNSSDIEIYTATGQPNPAWAPTITSVPSTFSRGTTQVIHGTQFNGLSQAVGYGDDVQGATNYPLVRITNNASGHVFFARTHDHSTMGVATGTLDVSTSFDVPAGAEVGASRLVVIANGIASLPATVTVQ